MDETRRDLSPEQVGAIKRSIELGRTLQQEHPEIADLYRQGYTLPDIVGELDIRTEYDVSNMVAQGGVRRVLSGHNGSLGIRNYDGFLSKEEIERLGKEHMSEAGLRTYREGMGIYAMTPKQKRAASKMGGRTAYEEGRGFHVMIPKEKKETAKMGGNKSYKEGKGIFGRTKEKISRNNREGGKRSYHLGKGAHALTPTEKEATGRLSAIKRGFVPWIDEETREAYELALLPVHRRGKLVNAEKIAEELNKKYHGERCVRTASAIRGIIYRICRKSLEKKVEN